MQSYIDLIRQEKNGAKEEKEISKFLNINKQKKFVFLWDETKLTKFVLITTVPFLVFFCCCCCCCLLVWMFVILRVVLWAPNFSCSNDEVARRSVEWQNSHLHGTRWLCWRWSKRWNSRCSVHINSMYHLFSLHISLLFILFLQIEFVFFFVWFFESFLIGFVCLVKDQFRKTFEESQHHMATKFGQQQPKEAPPAQSEEVKTEPTQKPEEKKSEQTAPSNSPITAPPQPSADPTTKSTTSSNLTDNSNTTSTSSTIVNNTTPAPSTTETSKWKCRSTVQTQMTLWFFSI